MLSKPKLTAATSEADSIAAQFATIELFKTKIHLLAGDSILNTDGENHHFGYDQLAEANITTESTDVYSAAHPFGDAEATKHLWIRGFHEAATHEGQAASVEYGTPTSAEHSGFTKPAARTRPCALLVCECASSPNPSSACVRVRACVCVCVCVCTLRLDPEPAGGRR